MTTMECKTIRYEVVDRVARLTLDRPDRRNAWTGRMHLEYRWALTEAEADPGVRVVVVTGAGPSFCVGADARALEGHVDKGRYDDGLRGTEPPMPVVTEPFAADFAFQLGMRTPIIASVNGAAAGVGLVIACFADIRFAAAGAKLTTAAPKLGFPAEYGLSWLLPDSSVPAGPPTGCCPAGCSSPRRPPRWGCSPPCSRPTSSPTTSIGMPTTSPTTSPGCRWR